MALAATASKTFQKTIPNICLVYKSEGVFVISIANIFFKTRLSLMGVCSLRGNISEIKLSKAFALGRTGSVLAVVSLVFFLKLL